MAEIVLFSHHIGGLGGVQQFIDQIATRFALDGHDVTVIGCATQNGISFKPDSKKKYKEVTLYTEDVFTKKPHKLFIDSFITHKSAKYIQNIIDGKKNPIIIIANPIVFVFLKNVDLSNAGAVIGQFHSSAEFLYSIGGIFQIYKYMIRHYYKNIDQFLMLTAEDAKIMHNKLGWDNIGYIANPLRFNIPIEECSNLKQKRIVFVGRLTEVKQVDQAIQAFSIVASQFPDWNFDIYGDGELYKEIEGQIARLQINNQVHMHGAVSDVAKIYKTASIFILSSRMEGMPIALMEAMSFGVPATAYNCSPGVSSVLSSDCGILVSQDDVNELANAIKTMMQSESLLKSLGDNSYKKIQQFSEDKIVAEWYSIFETIFKSKKLQFVSPDIQDTKKVSVVLPTNKKKVLLRKQ